MLPIAGNRQLHALTLARRHICGGCWHVETVDTLDTPRLDRYCCALCTRVRVSFEFSHVGHFRVVPFVHVGNDIHGPRMIALTDILPSLTWLTLLRLKGTSADIGVLFVLQERHSVMPQFFPDLIVHFFCLFCSFCISLFSLFSRLFLRVGAEQQSCLLA